ncbi:C-GCAxxG-C-C family protein [Petroclostridium sp. X23]|uniref:C-GCAxxG-C-C family protein n=1 Tax=Petroclostridium sp. X23 TaxID=3045146 RepID=UPI0024AC9542|nr:C-GCAxxG-C-C family protein [Petroclostridium sp. X23]WHH60491.1 C-GCAxxG-C-C family protein [Petroclostridium sp. X23]
MDDILERVTELALEKYCCAQIVMAIGLEMLDKDNPDLIRAMKGMCHGVCTYRFCGTLAAAACVLSLYHEHYSSVLIPELVRWFEDRYGSVTCFNITEGKIDMSRCLKITADTCMRCFELIEENRLVGDE